MSENQFDAEAGDKTQSSTFVTDLDHRLKEHEPPEEGESCPNCPDGSIEKNGRLELPFGDIMHYTCPQCEFETVGPIP
ncbi:Rcat domain-containing protein [Halorussus salinisoli]|uniref:hypothetical protein n=1 Tax=Halorussus salinisoli TaxID=2558242 RepID=UPI0010C17035|nr:hypothetical protein [Halorussus salinisoli]